MPEGIGESQMVRLKNQDGRKYNFFDTTGDIGIYVYGKDLAELFANAGEALFSLITKVRRKKDENKEIKLFSDSLENLLIIWLNELIFNFDTYGFIGNSFNLKITKKKDIFNLNSSVTGYIFDREKDEMGLLIKAATYHNFYLKETNDGYEARILFDI
ncbi:MAG: archease [Proteobacteria bacterium]|nr:archease [Pseudomonadota bacterium]